MKSKTSKQSAFNPNEILEIKNPVWALWVCLLAMIGCLVTYFVFLFLKTRNVIATDTFYIGYIFWFYHSYRRLVFMLGFARNLHIQTEFTGIIGLSAKINVPQLNKSARLKF